MFGEGTSPGMEEHVLRNDKYDLICCSGLQEATGGALK